MPGKSNIHHRLKIYAKHLPNGCIIWTGFQNDDGYGEVFYERKKWRVHRLVAVLYLNFDNDPDVEVTHTCDNPPCYNENHLKLDSHKGNMSDSRQKNRHFQALKTHCKNGHDFNVHGRYTGIQRICKACDRNRKRDYKGRNVWKV